MIDIPGKYQASIFGNFADISPSTEIISKMLEIFHDKNLLPGTYREISPQSQSPLLRLMLLSPNEEWEISFSTNRMNVEKKYQDNIDAFGSIDAFANESEELFSRILTNYKKKIYRIALITNGLLKEMTNDKMLGIFQNFFNPIDFYRKNSPYEWNSRYVANVVFQISGSEEQVNLITSLNRINGQITKPDTILNFDRIEVGLDINTSQKNKETRFDSSSLKPFYLEAIKQHDKILSELGAIIDV